MNDGEVPYIDLGNFKNKALLTGFVVCCLLVVWMAGDLIVFAN